MEKEICPICQDRGVFITSEGLTKKCTCKIELELKTFLRPLLNYPLNKTINFQQLKKSLHIKGGTDTGFYSLVKSFLFQYYFKVDQSIKMVYNFETGSSIIEDYLSQERHHHLYDVPLLFIDLTKFYNNKAMGEVIHYTLQQRQSRDLLYWCYTGSMSLSSLTDHYCIQLQEHLCTIPQLNIDNYTRKLTE